MSLGRVMGLILSVLTIAFFINNEVDNKNNNNNLIEIVGNVAQVKDNNINYDTISLSNENNSNTEIIKYTNKQAYPIDITASDISINCQGSSNNDIELVNKNMRIKAYFSQINDSNKTTSIQIKPKETINIYVINEYIGEKYPETEVTCNYSINIQDF